MIIGDNLSKQCEDALVSLRSMEENDRPSGEIKAFRHNDDGGIDIFCGMNIELVLSAKASGFTFNWRTHLENNTVKDTQDAIEWLKKTAAEAGFVNSFNCSSVDNLLKYLETQEAHA